MDLVGELLPTLLMVSLQDPDAVLLFLGRLAVGILVHLLLRPMGADLPELLGFPWDLSILIPIEDRPLNHQLGYIAILDPYIMESLPLKFGFLAQIGQWLYSRQALWK